MEYSTSIDESITLSEEDHDEMFEEMMEEVRHYVYEWMNENGREEIRQYLDSEVTKSVNSRISLLKDPKNMAQLKRQNAQNPLSKSQTAIKREK
jgi:hypothetical protein